MKEKREAQDRFMRLYWFVLLPGYIGMFWLASLIGGWAVVGLTVVSIVAFYWAMARAMR